MIENFENLTGAKENKDDTILGILPKIDLNSHSNPRFNVNCHFINYRDSNQRREDYFEFIHDTLIEYMLERKKYNNIGAGKQSTRLNKEAKGKIWDILEKENEKNDGLLGEWNLYLFLEYIENAKKLVSRMTLDTATQGNRKGLDGVHFKVEDGKLYIYLLEAKVYEDIKDGIKSALSSINKFFYDDRYKKEQINIIGEHLDLGGDKKLEEYLLKTDFFIPSSIISSEEILSIFIMFDSNSLKIIEDKHKKKFSSEKDLRDDIEKEFQKYIEEEIYNELEKQISSDIFKESGIKKTKIELELDEKEGKKQTKTKTINKNNEIKNKKFIFYFLPVKDIKNLRIDFKKYVRKN